MDDLLSMQKMSAKVQNGRGNHRVRLCTDNQGQGLSIPPKPGGRGSSVNGGELLFLALATCYCNDVYREAEKRGVKVLNVEVEVEGEFGSEGDPAKNIIYSTRIEAETTEEEILSIAEHTDRVAEVHNTIRKGMPVMLAKVDAVSL